MHMLQRFLFELSRIWTWLHGKRSEISQLNYKDAFMAHLVLEIMQSSPKPNIIIIPLSSLIPIHPVNNRESTIEATKKRAENLEAHKEEIEKAGTMTKELSAKYLPSLTYIRAVESGDGRYFTFEGNGRVAALNAVFGHHENFDVELEVFYPRKPERTIRKIKKLRKLHKML